MKKVISNSDLHFEHQQWLKEIMLWQDELKSFRNRLEEIQQRWTDKAVLSRLDQFQNQFVIHSKKIDEMRDEIQGHEHNIALIVNDNKNFMDRDGYLHHRDIRERMETERLMQADLKKRFFGFLSRYM